MNHSPSGLLFSQYVDGFVKYKNAEGLSRRTVEFYELDLNRWMEKIGYKPIGKVTQINVRDYLAYLRTDYEPHTFAKPNASEDKSTPRLSPKTLRNHWITVTAFFRWAEVEFKIPNPMTDIPGPRYKSAPVPSFSQE
jgi:integrase/recombinase XerD